MKWLGISVVAVAVIAVGLAFIAVIGSYEIKLTNQRADFQQQKDTAVKNAIVSTQLDERRVATANRDKLVAAVNGTADAEVAAGDEAAALVPMLKSRAELVELCKPGTACRTNAAAGSFLEPASPLIPNNTTVDHNGQE